MYNLASQCIFRPGILLLLLSFFPLVCFPVHLLVCLLPQVKHLEDEKKKLDTKLKILKEREEYGGKIDDIVKQLEHEMEEQIENLIRDREKLQAELLKKQEEVEDTKKRLVGHGVADVIGTNLLFLLTVSHIKPLNEKQGCAHIKCSVVEGKQLTCFSSSDSVSYVIIGTKYPSSPPPPRLSLRFSYEDELQKKAELENDFILIKKVL